VRVLLLGEQHLGLFLIEGHRSLEVRRANGGVDLGRVAPRVPQQRADLFQEQCVEALHQEAQAVEKLGLKVTEDVPGGSFAATDADRDIRGQCLPDTEDPRRSKGK